MFVPILYKVCERCDKVIGYRRCIKDISVFVCNTCILKKVISEEVYNIDDKRN